ncbi:TPA: 50S ribosomal protein L30 [Candidatus Bathyarchaeota archaeon]|nr:50S ribosomal protein L30 [Candidatus Bathyarchaeota archaeon]
MKARERARCLAVVRIRGITGPRRDVKDTFRMLGIKRRYHATLVPSTPAYLGMLRKAKDWITWGPVSKDVISLLLRKRGKVSNRRRLTDDYVREALGFDSIDELASALYECKVTLNKLGIKPFFALHPPSKGFKRSTKRHFRARGELGDREEAINDLLRRMA